jgi:hypothetical protein
MRQKEGRPDCGNPHHSAGGSNPEEIILTGAGIILVPASNTAVKFPEVTVGFAGKTII